MLAAIPAHEMAETLCILAGSNAGNAARHFGKQSYEAGDIAAAVLWSSIAQALDRTGAAADEPEGQLGTLPVPRRMAGLLAETAFQGLWFEDVDADVLTREALQETLETIAEPAAGNSKAATDFPHAEYGAASGEHGMPERARKLELVAAQVPQSEAGDTSGSPSSPIWSRIEKRGSTRMAA